MTNKSFKVKHFRSRIYNPIRGKILKVLLTVAAVVLLFVLGWFTYEPLMQKLNTVNKEIIEENPVVPPEETEEAEELLPQFVEKENIAVTVPEDVLYSNYGYISFLRSLDENVTAVIIDMKTKSGTVTYLSEQEGIKNRKSVSEDAVDISKRVDTARSMGFDVVARIYTFQDNLAPYGAYNMAIRYESDDGVLWLDDSIDNGGKPWLNPYSDTAQKYILDIVYDAVDNKFDAIILDGLRFPGDAGINYAYFGASAETTGRNDVLKQFVEHVYATTVTTDTDLLIAYDGFTVISGNDNIYGGSPATFSGDGLSPVIDLNAFVGNKIKDTVYKELPDDVSEMSLAIYDALGYGTNKNLFPVFVCKGLADEQLKQLEDSFLSCGAKGFFIEYDDVFFNGEPLEEVLSEETESEDTEVKKKDKSSVSGKTVSE